MPKDCVNSIEISPATVSRSQPPLHQDPVPRPIETHSRLTREGNSYLEIDIPPYGLTNGAPFFACCSLIAFKILTVVGFGCTLMGLILFGLAGLGFLGLVASGASSVFSVFVLRNYWFCHDNLKITTDGYCLLRKKVTWSSFLKTLIFPSSAKDLEAGALPETKGKEFHGYRNPSLRAQLPHFGEMDNEPLRCIRLGSFYFAYLFQEEEVKWLADQINQFLHSKP